MNVVQPNITLYPDGWPVPNRDLSAAIDYGVYRTDFGAYPDQGRYYGTNPTVQSVSFDVPFGILPEWIAFMDAYAVSQWILIRTVSQGHGIFVDTQPLRDVIVRVGALSQTPIGPDWVRVNTSMEIMPSDIGNALPGADGEVLPPGAPPLIEDWIVAGTPGNPSTSNWILAGEPPGPSTNTITSGKPADHT